MKLTTPYKFALLFAGLGLLVYAAFIGARIIGYTGGEFSRTASDVGLIEATRKQDTTAMRALVVFGADPNARGPAIGVPSLSVAAREGLARSAELLLDLGAEPDGAKVVFEGSIPPAGDSVIFTLDRPMFIAAMAGNHEIVSLLREQKAKYEPIDAIVLGDEAAIQGMLAAGSVELDISERVKNMALAIAVNKRNLGAVERLLKHGANPYDAPIPGTSAWDWANDTGSTEILDLIARLAPRPEDTGV